MINEENFAQWIAALRSGRFEQGRGALHNGGYCCLGVACELMGLEGKPMPNHRVAYDGEVFLAPLSVIQWFGVSSPLKSRWGGTDLVPDWPEGWMSQGSQPEFEQVSLELVGTAASMNDAGFTFDQIADVFEYFGLGGTL